MDALKDEKPLASESDNNVVLPDSVADAFSGSRAPCELVLRSRGVPLPLPCTECGRPLRRPVSRVVSM
jgi:hypothetical protein